MSEEFEYITLKLPRHIKEWLELISREFAMTPSQLITNILTTFMDVWEMGREYERKRLTVEEAEQAAQGVELYEAFLKYSKEVSESKVSRKTKKAVSYTHLTLPTN